jgi:hypothetical protein
MNVFVPQPGAPADTPCIPIDFQWTGLGLGMSDVAMHLFHSVEVSALENGGEEALLRYYHMR